MAATIDILQRSFEFDDVVLSDPDPAMTENEVLEYYSGAYPELAAGTIESRVEEDGKLVYKIKVSTGSKA